MKYEIIEKESFAVLGKEGSTLEGAGFIAKLWADANAHFPEAAAIAKKDENGNFAGFWGAMSDLSRPFAPWEDNFSKGLYLAGVEIPLDAEPVDGWTKWVIPSQKYLVVVSGETAFKEAIDFIKASGRRLVGAAHDFTSPKDGKNYIYLPIEKL